MSAQIGLHLVEEDVRLIIQYLRDNLDTHLAYQQTLHTGDVVNVSLSPIVDYFPYMKAQGYRTPCVFLIPERADFKKRERGPNFIDSENRINLSVLIEDKDAERIQYKSYRYLAALVGALDQLQLTSADGKIKITVVVAFAEFSPLYSNTTDPTASQSVFRKEVWVELDVQHYEALT